MWEGRRRGGVEERGREGKGRSKGRGKKGGEGERREFVIGGEGRVCVCHCDSNVNHLCVGGGGADWCHHVVNHILVLKQVSNVVV